MKTGSSSRESHEKKFANPHWAIGQFLAYQRKRFGFDSQTEFARRLGISRFYLSNIESGRTPLKLKTAWECCRLLDIHPDFLISKGSLNPGPFSVIEEPARESVEKLVTVHSTADFLSAWRPISSVVLEAMPVPIGADPEKDIDTVTSLGNTGGVNSEISKLIVRLKRATSKPGSKAALARFLGVERPRISEYLSGEKEPGGNNALLILQWVQEQERQKQKP
jgi:transcriptional regulator with XRE-family HTH domain